MGRIFIYFLICQDNIIHVYRQKREKALREQKDKMILQMALEQKKKMAEGKKVNKRNNLHGLIWKINR